jgi:hypothetical protein
MMISGDILFIMGNSKKLAMEPVLVPFHILRNYPELNPGDYGQKPEPKRLRYDMLEFH